MGKSNRAAQQQRHTLMRLIDSDLNRDRVQSVEEGNLQELLHSKYGGSNTVAHHMQKRIDQERIERRMNVDGSEMTTAQELAFREECQARKTYMTTAEKLKELRDEVNGVVRPVTDLASLIAAVTDDQAKNEPKH